MPSQEHPKDVQEFAPYSFKEWPQVVTCSDGEKRTFDSQAAADAFEESLHPQKSKSGAKGEAASSGEGDSKGEGGSKSSGPGASPAKK